MMAAECMYTLTFANIPHFNCVVERSSNDLVPISVEVQTDITQFLDFITTIVFAFGIAFEVPVATVLIVWAGLTDIEKLGKARPYVFLMAFIAGMFLTPPDVISQSLLAVPVYLLYELGIIMSRIFIKNKTDD